jgi:hypothetical protein
MTIKQAKELKRGSVILINHITGKDELARVVRWDERAQGIDYHAISGGGSICKPEHIIKVLDEKPFYESEIWAQAWKEKWNENYKRSRNAL